jgi:dienelactone hydrolase
MDTQLVTQGCPVGGAGHNGSTSAESQLLGCTLGDASCAAQAQSADPTQYARAAHPPHLILHGSEDCNVPAEQSAVLARAIAPNGSCVVQRRVVGAGHGGPSWTSPEVQDATAQFLDRVLNRPTASPVVVNCAAFAITGDATAANGARWTYQSTDDGVAYNLNGVLFAPSGNALAPGVVVSHGKGGSATGYSSTVARTMRDWGMVAIATNYNHAPDNIDAGQLPQGDDGASTANVQRAHKARDLLSCIANVDMRRLAAHGHSMGGFVTGQMLGTFPGDFRAASHSAGGATENGPNATRSSAAAAIRTPYQLHHGDADTVVVLALDQALQEILTTNGAANQLHVYSAYTHEQIAFDALMLERVRDWYRAHGVL